MYRESKRILLLIINLLTVTKLSIFRRFFLRLSCDAKVYTLSLYVASIKTYLSTHNRKNPFQLNQETLRVSRIWLEILERDGR